MTPVRSTLTFMGNATVLIKLGPFVVLTDPNFLHAGQRAYLGHGLSTKRLLEPALAMSALPPLDLVLLSHLHGDHWDRVTRRQLDRTVPIVTTPHASRRLRRWHGFPRTTGLQTWETHTMRRHGWTLNVTSTPGMHAPGLAGRLLPPVMGSLLELDDPSGHQDQSIYITGDTLMHAAIAQVAHRRPDLDLAVLHLGGTRLPGGMLVTMDGVQGAQMVQALRPRLAVPVHTEDYAAFKSPLHEFVDEVERRGIRDVVRIVGRGETTTFG